MRRDLVEQGGPTPSTSPGTTAHREATGIRQEASLPVTATKRGSTAPTATQSEVHYDRGIPTAQHSKRKQQGVKGTCEQGDGKRRAPCECSNQEQKGCSANGCTGRRHQTGSVTSSVWLAAYIHELPEPRRRIRAPTREHKRGLSLLPFPPPPPAALARTPYRLTAFALSGPGKGWRTARPTRAPARTCAVAAYNALRPSPFSGGSQQAAAGQREKAPAPWRFRRGRRVQGSSRWNPPRQVRPGTNPRPPTACLRAPTTEPSREWPHRRQRRPLLKDPDAPQPPKRRRSAG